MSIKGKRKKIMLAASRENENSDSEAVVESDSMDNENVVEKKEKKGKKLKRKINAVSPDEEPTRDDNELHESAVQPDATTTENESKPKTKKNKKKKLAEKEVSVEETAITNSAADGTPVATNDVKQTTDTENGESKENIQQENAATLNKLSKKKSKKKKKAVAKSSRVKKLPSGLVIEKLVIGDPKAKRASHGKKVGVRFTGKLKSNDKIFDSNIGSKMPLKFRLGMGKVIKGWDVGIKGMGVGDKRRLTIPPAMGYGSKGCALAVAVAVPPNAWLVFDVELVSVH